MIQLGTMYIHILKAIYFVGYSTKKSQTPYEKGSNFQYYQFFNQAKKKPIYSIS